LSARPRWIIADPKVRLRLKKGTVATDTIDMNQPDEQRVLGCASTSIARTAILPTSTKRSAVEAAATATSAYMTQQPIATKIGHLPQKDNQRGLMTT
jgi:hypothetical protein